MGRRPDYKKTGRYMVPALLVLTILSACRSTKHLKEDEYLLWKNRLELRTNKVMLNKGEIKDNLEQQAEEIETSLEQHPGDTESKPESKPVEPQNTYKRTINEPDDNYYNYHNTD